MSCITNNFTVEGGITFYVRLNVRCSIENSINNKLLGELVETADGSMTIRHPDHLETYHSSAGAETEALELYVKASGLIARFASGASVTVLDVGLGLGYNALATIEAWMKCAESGDLDIVSLEWSRDLVTALVNGAAPWTEIWSPQRTSIVARLSEITPGIFYVENVHPMNASKCKWTILVGDARETTLGLQSKFSYIWQDPFSPEKNPGMWDAGWFKEVKRIAATDAVLMSYSVARSVRDALNDAGWLCERFKTPVRQKKQWLRAKLP